MRRLLLLATLHTAAVATAGSSTGDRSSSTGVPLPANNANIQLHGCLLKNLTSLPFCDASGKLSFAARAADLVRRLTLDEKIACTGGQEKYDTAVPRLGLPAYNWGVEDDHGAGTACVSGAGADGKPRWHCPTVFPTLSIVGATFNETLFEAVGKAVGTEMRAANNAGATRGRHFPVPGTNPLIGVNGWGPNLNIQRDVRWGRNSEVPSEDPLLAGKLGAAMSRGLQGPASDKYVLTLGALKHVTAYSLENWRDDTGGPRNGTKYSRMGFEGTINRHDLAETYLEQYRIAIAEGNTLGMMCSYAAINGTESCENGALLTTWARHSQGFEGNIVTDCGAEVESSEPKNRNLSAADALNAGTDLNCGSVYDNNLKSAISLGLTTEAALDASLARSFTLLMRAGYFDPLQQVPHAAIPPSAMGSDANHRLAKEAALQGMIMVRNAEPKSGASKALPLQKGKVTAVLGPLANATLTMASRYYDAVCHGPNHPNLPWGRGTRPSGCIASPLAQLRKRGKVLHAVGIACNNSAPGHHCTTSTDESGFGAAIAAAKQADQVVIFVGTSSYGTEAEGMDRQSISLPGAQGALLKAVRKAVPTKPITVVVMSGGMMAIDSLATTAPVCDALVQAFKPGIEGGEALACALFGETDCNRWGKLPVTMFPSTFAGKGGNDMANMGVSTGGSGMRTYKYLPSYSCC